MSNEDYKDRIITKLILIIAPFMIIVAIAISQTRTAIMIINERQEKGEAMDKLILERLR